MMQADTFWENLIFMETQWHKKFCFEHKSTGWNRMKYDYLCHDLSLEKILMTPMVFIITLWFINREVRKWHLYLQSTAVYGGFLLDWNKNTKIPILKKEANRKNTRPYYIGQAQDTGTKIYVISPISCYAIFMLVFFFQQIKI